MVTDTYTTTIVTLQRMRQGLITRDVVPKINWVGGGGGETIVLQVMA